MNDDNIKISDDRLREIERGDATVLSKADAMAMASELLARRHRARRDSYTAEQVRKMRWTCESLMKRLEEFPAKAARVADEMDREVGQ